MIYRVFHGWTVGPFTIDAQMGDARLGYSTSFAHFVRYQGVPIHCEPLNYCDAMDLAEDLADAFSPIRAGPAPQTP